MEMNQRRVAHCLVAAVLLIATISARAALIPPFMINSVVAIGLPSNANPAGQIPNVEWVTFGTGFFYGYKVKDNPNPGNRRYAVYLVTAGHVIAEFRATEQGQLHHPLEVRVNSADPTQGAQTFAIADSAWFFHPNFKLGVPDYDVAAVQVNGAKVNELGASFIPDDQAAADRTKLRAIGTSAGDGAFVLGFPMNLAGEQRNYVIVRGGTIARISELLDSSSSTFLLDSFVFPGNSGSPVILRPELTGIQGTQVNRQALLIGMVIDYKPYIDVAVSQQTHRPRITFEENSGLADVIPMDRVDEAIAAHSASDAYNPHATDGSPIARANPRQ
jgi:hypothetical protein